jgi:hypothetical protein
MLHRADAADYSRPGSRTGLYLKDAGGVSAAPTAGRR